MFGPAINVTIHEEGFPIVQMVGKWKDAETTSEMWERVFEGMEEVFRKRFGLKYTDKKRPNVYGQMPLVRTGKLKQSLTGQNSYSVRDIMGDTAEFGTRAPFAAILNSGMTSNTQRIRIPKKSIGLLSPTMGRLVWVDEHGRKHRAQMTMDSGFTIPPRPVFKPLTKMEAGKIKTMLIGKMFKRLFGRWNPFRRGG
jgi:phage gpG-like protein